MIEYKTINQVNTRNQHMKKRQLLLALSIIGLSASKSFCQNVKKQHKTSETKIELFSSRAGAIIKFIDYRLPNLNTYLGGSAKSRVRKVISGQEEKCFYQIENQGKYSSSTASIEYLDLIEVIKSVSSLKTQYQEDIQLKPDYMENKFTTVDGFQVGYYIEGDKGSWYMRLERSGSDNTLFINKVETIEESFAAAKAKIESIKK